ncbi:MAG: hypothetical protein ACJA01_001615 [Saprospiraceae bacterium]|jgi:hypothetical protein
MRSIKEFNVNQIKCTLFLHNMKYSLQMEDESYLFSLKLGSKEASEIEQLEETLNSPAVIQYLLKSFSMLHDTRLVIEKEAKFENDEFQETII